MTQNINLLNPSLVPRRDWASARNLAIGAACALLIMAASSAAFRLSAERQAQDLRAVEARVADAQQRLAALTRIAAESRPNARLAAEIKQAEALLALRKELVQALEGGGLGRSDGFAEVLRGLARQSMEGLWLTGFSLRDGSEMEITGRMMSPELLPSYIRRLNGEKAFQGRSFAVLTMKGREAAVAAPAAGEPPPGDPAGQAFIEFTLASREADAKSAERRP